MASRGELLAAKTKELTPVGKFSDEAFHTLAALADWLIETDPTSSKRDNTQPVVNQIQARRRRARKVEAVKQAVGVVLFLILYIVANSVAPTVWTAAGTVPLN